MSHLRFHLPHAHLHSVFGDDWFALKAEAFARFFGTPAFILGQTIVVVLWIVLNATGVVHFDLYPFILLNLGFSLQAAYASPFILLAQTRQAERDKHNVEADALHREEIAKLSEEKQKLIIDQNNILMKMMEQNTMLTENIKTLTEHVETLTSEVHKNMVAN
jgi:uncharacterized membrane protein